MSAKLIFVGLTIGIARALPHALPDSPPIYSVPEYVPEPYHPPPPATYQEDEPKKPYAFDYGVKDDYSGANFNHAENSDGSSVSGSYKVFLPDGRIQTVNYVADHYNGYHAQVTYEGEAQYPEAQHYVPPQPYNPAPPQYPVDLPPPQYPVEPPPPQYPVEPPPPPPTYPEEAIPIYSN
ncbi:cuticle protein 7-like [Macrobrachium rosenbergii]|uniref:cuticle protein 7-like n=1 Tax=Macrobrachium rosenbergii TaxID=79674 RepID=UPI0034D679D2